MRPRIVAWDIETTNLRSTFGRILCVGFAEVGKREVVIFRADDPQYKGKNFADDSKLVAAVKDYLEDSFIWLSWYGKLFDVPFLNGRLLLNGLPPLEKRMHIDLFYYSRGQFVKFHSSRLDAIAKSFELKTQKTDLVPQIWVRAQNGETEALNEVVKHCQHDVRVLRDALPLLAPFIANISK